MYGENAAAIICSIQCCETVTFFTVPVPTFDKLRFRFRLHRYLDHFFKEILEKSCLFSFYKVSSGSGF
jgi:hypothetical protein